MMMATTIGQLAAAADDDDCSLLVARADWLPTVDEKLANSCEPHTHMSFVHFVHST